MPHQFDPDRPGEIQGLFGSVIVADPAVAPNHVLDPSKAFTVTMTWRLVGPDVPLWLAGLAPSDWDVKVYAESMAPTRRPGCPCPATRMNERAPRSLIRRRRF